MIYKTKKVFFETIICLNILVRHEQTPIQLIRIRNPHGDEGEWNGAWSDRRISKVDAENLKLKIDFDGEFWMCLKDFLKNFDLLDICHLYTKKENLAEFHGKQSPLIL